MTTPNEIRKIAEQIRKVDATFDIANHVLNEYLETASVVNAIIDEHAKQLGERVDRNRKLGEDEKFLVGDIKALQMGLDALANELDVLANGEQLTDAKNKKGFGHTKVAHAHNIVGMMGKVMKEWEELSDAFTERNASKIGRDRLIKQIEAEGFPLTQNQLLIRHGDQPNGERLGVQGRISDVNNVKPLVDELISTVSSDFVKEMEGLDISVRAGIGAPKQKEITASKKPVAGPSPTPEQQHNSFAVREAQRRGRNSGQTPTGYLRG